MRAPDRPNGSNWWSKLAALTLKEAKQVARDPSSWVVTFVLPTLFLLFFGYAISLDADNLRLAVFDESLGEHSESLSFAFARSRHFRVQPVTSRHEATQLMADSAVQGVLVIPENFDALAAAARPSAVQLMVDGTEPNTATFMGGYVNGVIAGWEEARLTEEGNPFRAPIAAEPVYWYNNATKSRWAMVPGSMTIVIALIGILQTSLVITREWERGTMEALFASPVTRLQIFLSKLIPYYLLALLAMAFCVAAGTRLFGVPFRGSFIALFALTTAFLMPSLGQGLLISSSFRSQLPAAMVGFLTGMLPSFILSGMVFDINSMPWPIRIITHVIPARYFNVSLQTLFLAGDVWPLFWRDMAAMAAIGLVFFTLSYRNLKRRLD